MGWKRVRYPAAHVIPREFNTVFRPIVAQAGRTAEGPSLGREAEGAGSAPATSGLGHKQRVGSSMTPRLQMPQGGRSGSRARRIDWPPGYAIIQTCSASGLALCAQSFSSELRRQRRRMSFAIATSTSALRTRRSHMQVSQACATCRVLRQGARFADMGRLRSPLPTVNPARGSRLVLGPASCTYTTTSSGGPGAYAAGGHSGLITATSRTAHSGAATAVACASDRKCARVTALGVGLVRVRFASRTLEVDTGAGPSGLALTLARRSVVWAWWRRSPGVSRCSKVQYQTRWQAERVLSAIRRSKSPSRRERASYRCPACGTWHLTSKR